MLLISISKMVLNCSFPVVMKLNNYLDTFFVSTLAPHTKRHGTPKKAVRMCSKYHKEEFYVVFPRYNVPEAVKNFTLFFHKTYPYVYNKVCF